MCVRWGNSTSPDFLVGNGAKQGGIISPILFNIYMDDLSMHLNSSGIGGYLGTAFINHLCYADDLQQLLHTCNEYAAQHQLIYNGFKSFSVCFKRKDFKINSPTFFLDLSKIPLVEQCRYLGTTISIKNGDLDLKRQMRKVYANANLLLRKFSNCSVNVKCYLLL